MRQETPDILFNKSLRVLAIFATSLPVGCKYANLGPLFKWLIISNLYSNGEKQERKRVKTKGKIFAFYALKVY